MKRFILLSFALLCAVHLPGAVSTGPVYKYTSGPDKFRITEDLIFGTGRTLRMEPGSTFNATGATLVGLGTGASLATGTVNQTLHGFTVGTAIQRAVGSSTWSKAISTNYDSALVQAVVDTASTNSFTATTHGKINLNGWTPGLYYLSSTTPGLVTLTPPAYASTNYLVPVVYVASSTEAYVTIGAPLALKRITSDALAGFTNDVTFTAPSAEGIASSLATWGYINARLDGLTLPFSSVTNFHAGKLAGRYSPGTGGLQEIDFGAGLELVDGVLRATATGSAAPFTIAASEINWALGNIGKKVLSGSVAFTDVNTVDGASIGLELSATGANRTPTWPANYYWGTPGAPVITNNTTTLARVRRVGSVVYGWVEGAGFTPDVIPPTFASAAINGDGDRLVVTHSETIDYGSAGHAGAAGAALSTGQTLTYLSHTGATVTSSIAPVVKQGATPYYIYTFAANTLQDLGGLAMQSMTSGVITNGSTISDYFFEGRFDTGVNTAPSGMAAGGTGTVVFNYTPGLEGAGAASVTGDGKNITASFSSRNQIWGYFECILPAGGSSSDIVSCFNQFAFSFRSDNRINAGHGTGGTTVTSSSTGGVASGTRVNGWFYYRRETSPGSADGWFDLYMNKTGFSTTRPGSICTIRNGTGDAVTAVTFYNRGSGATIWDKILLSDTEIVSNPN